MLTFIHDKVYGTVVTIYAIPVLIFSPSILAWENFYGTMGNWAASAVFGIAAALVIPFWFKMREGQGYPKHAVFALAVTNVIFCIQQAYFALT